MPLTAGSLPKASRLVTRRVLLALSVAAAPLSCGGDTSTSSAPTAPTTSSFATVTISGTLTNTQTGAPVPLAYLNTVGSSNTAHFETDASGRFSIVLAPASWTSTYIGVASSRVSSGASPPYVEHIVALSSSASRSSVALDAIQDTAPFSGTLYRELVRDARDTPPGNQTLRRWTVNPSFYIRSTHVDTGAAIPAVILSQLETMFRNSVPELSGNKFSVAAIESGPEARAAKDGWVNVLFQYVLPNPLAGGQATVGGNSGTIWLRFDPAVPNLIYGGTACSQATGAAEHEIVHTMGFYHVSEIPGVDKPFQSPDFCGGRNRPEIIRYHAAIAYARPVGNSYPDVDPASSLAVAPASIGPAVGCFVERPGTIRRR